MRIAQIAPLTESVPPKLYGGTERVVAFLTDELVAMGHDVTLFASGDSVTRAKLEPMHPKALRFDTNLRDAIAPHMLMLEQVAAAGRRVRCAALPPGLLAVLAVQPPGHAVRHHAARPARPAGAEADLPLLRRRAAGVDLRCAAAAAAEREFHRDGAPWAAGGPAGAAAGEAGLPGVPRPHLPGEVPRSRDRDRPAHRHPAENGRQGGPGGRGLPRDGHPPADRRQAGRAYRRDRRRREGRFPQRRAGAAAADRLAGAVRAGDDRGDGLRHAGDRVPGRLGAGGRSRTA